MLSTHFDSIIVPDLLRRVVFVLFVYRLIDLFKQVVLRTNSVLRVFSIIYELRW